MAERYRSVRDPARLLSVREVTAMAKISRTRLYQLMREGKLPRPQRHGPTGFNVGWPQEVVARWLASRT